VYYLKKIGQGNTQKFLIHPKPEGKGSGKNEVRKK